MGRKRTLSSKSLRYHPSGHSATEAGKEKLEDSGIERAFKFDAATKAVDPTNLGLEPLEAVKFDPKEVADLWPLDKFEFAASA